MNAPEWLKPGIYAAVVGATALAIIGFTWGGWMTGGDAKNMASDQSRMAVVAALVPICIEQSKQDPEASATLAKLKETSSYQRSEVLMGTGWATMPGAEKPDRLVAGACMDKLAMNF